jgi:hypothetical protein
MPSTYCTACGPINADSASSSPANEDSIIAASISGASRSPYRLAFLRSAFP